MFCRANSPVRLLGSTLAVCAAALLVTSAPDRAHAGKFGRSFFKGSGGAPKHHDADSSSTAKHQDAEAASSGKHETSEDASSGGLSLRPSVKLKGEDTSAAKPEAEKAADGTTRATAAAAPAQTDKSKKNVVKLKEPHPLAAPHKGMDVVVCEAGCENEKQQVVYVQPTTASRDTVASEMQPNSSNGAAAAKDTIICMGGCYDTPKFYASAFASVTPAAQVNTSLKPTSARSGDWMRRIDNSRGGKTKK